MTAFRSPVGLPPAAAAAERGEDRPRIAEDGGVAVADLAWPGPMQGPVGHMWMDWMWMCGKSGRKVVLPQSPSLHRIKLSSWQNMQTSPDHQQLGEEGGHRSSRQKRRRRMTSIIFSSSNNGDVHFMDYLNERCCILCNSNRKSFFPLLVAVFTVFSLRGPRG